MCFSNICDVCDNFFNNFWGFLQTCVSFNISNNYGNVKRSHYGLQRRKKGFVTIGSISCGYVWILF